jgi:hypothetical protein
MEPITTSDELKAMVDLFLEHKQTRLHLDAILLEKFRADQSYLSTWEDVRCAWANLPSDDKLDYVDAWAREDAFSLFAAS